MEVEIGESSSQRVGKREKYCDDCNPGRIKKKLMKAVKFLAVIKDEEQNRAFLSS